MHNRFNFSTAILAAIAGSILLSGCTRDQAAERTALQPPPQVEVARVLTRTVRDSEIFTGRFEAVHHVNVRPRVTGYISSVDFTDGSEVHKGQLLFVIDPRPYRAVYLRAKAQLDQARAALRLARAERIRAVKLLAARAMSRDEYDTRIADASQAAADVEAARAAVDAAALNLTFTRVTAPISGRASRAIVTAGNLVTSGHTLLTTIVSLNPIYVTFNAGEQAYLKFEKYARLHHRAASGGGLGGLGNPVYVGLADEHGYPHEGRLVFMNNVLDPNTGTILARALLPNPGDRFVPGLFARVKLMGNHRYHAVLIDGSAVGTNQTVQYVFVLGPDDEARYRAVKLGPMVGGLRVVRSGLTPGETIVVKGLMRVQPGMRVSPERIAMGHARPAAGTMLARNDPHDSRPAGDGAGRRP